MLPESGFSMFLTQNLFHDCQWLFAHLAHQGVLAGKERSSQSALLLAHLIQNAFLLTGRADRRNLNPVCTGRSSFRCRFDFKSMFSRRFRHNLECFVQPVPRLIIDERQHFIARSLQANHDIHAPLLNNQAGGLIPFKPDWIAVLLWAWDFALDRFAGLQSVLWSGE